MARAAGVTAEIDAARVPLLRGALEHARAGDKPGGLTRTGGMSIEPHRRDRG